MEIDWSFSNLWVDKVKKGWRVTHLPTKLSYTHQFVEIACFELGKLVERQMQFNFEEQISGCVK